jgi:hypothetical protein
MRRRIPHGRKKPVSQSALLNSRILIGLLITLAEIIGNLTIGQPQRHIFAVWCDARESASRVYGDLTVLCYRMWARKSTEKGAFVPWLLCLSVERLEEGAA